jgi:glycosyltransferase involved in cell wall biosynthesis
MPVTHFYYHLKPYLPWGFRMVFRRSIARWKRRTHQDVWPINEAAGRPPEGWSGWPGGKKFALVLTHDIEGAGGLAKCRKLMKLEMELGFRSSFNFVPEGNYAVSRELREELAQNGFEVGIQDLRHDGMLFQNRETFRQGARQINRYLREWNAVGFRSAFMFHNLEWVHDLDVDYSSCTFDTDPFEPQSDGVGTIFPFWVPQSNSEIGRQKSVNGNSIHPSPFAINSHSSLTARLTSTAGGYVELPYTLPQDSTLFLVLRECSPEIWFKKLDWIAGQGGMALLNVHPDYLRFSDEPRSPRTYPAEFYVQLLQRLKQCYAGAYWQPLPRTLAASIAAVRPRHSVRRRRRICMVTHSFYESDGRVSRYAEALARRGDEVEVFGLRSSPDLPRAQTLRGVRLFRLQSRLGKRERTQSSYLFPLLRFLVLSSCRLTTRHLRRRYDLVHVHNVPDFLVFGAWLPKLTGAKVILDIHDIVPEFYASKFGSNSSPQTVRALKIMERLSAAFADHVIMSNHLWLEKYCARTRSADKCSVFINNVNSEVFHPSPRHRADGKTIVLFPGGLQWHQGVDIAIQAFQQVRAEIPSAELHIYGDGNMKQDLVKLTAELGLSDFIHFFRPVGLTEIAAVMADADLGIVPKRADSFGNEAYSTKIMEFMSVGVPVVVSSTTIDRYYFNESVVRFFESGNVEAMSAAMFEVLRDESLRQRLAGNALAYAKRHSWDTRKTDYLQLVDALVEGRPVSVSGNPPAFTDGNEVEFSSASDERQRAKVEEATIAEG